MACVASAVGPCTHHENAEFRGQSDHCQPGQVIKFPFLPVLRGSVPRFCECGRISSLPLPHLHVFKGVVTPLSYSRGFGLQSTSANFVCTYSVRRVYSLSTSSRFNSYSFSIIMKFSISSSIVIALSWANAAQAACSSNLVVDNYSNFASNLNTLGQWTSG